VRFSQFLEFIDDFVDFHVILLDFYHFVNFLVILLKFLAILGIVPPFNLFLWNNWATLKLGKKLLLSRLTISMIRGVDPGCDGLFSLIKAG